MERAKSTLEKEYKCRERLNIDYEKCTKIVDDIIKYSPWQDSEKLNLVELVAQTRTLEILVKNCVEWNQLFKRLQGLANQDIDIMMKDLEQILLDQRKFCDQLRRQRKE